MIRKDSKDEQQKIIHQMSAAKKVWDRAKKQERGLLKQINADVYRERMRELKQKFKDIQ